MFNINAMHTENRTHSVGGRPLHNAVIPSYRVILTNASFTNILSVNNEQMQHDWVMFKKLKKKVSQKYIIIDSSISEAEMCH